MSEVSEFLSALGMDVEELVNLAIAKKKGRLAVLPCSIGEKVYTISRQDCPCEICPNGENVGYSATLCSDLYGEGYECPPPQFEINEHICEGFEILADKDGTMIVSEPGEWGYEGLDKFCGCDGNVYYDYNAAKEAVEVLRKETEEGLEI